MTVPRWWWHAAQKDALALAPTWIWCAIAMVAGTITLGPAAGFAVYFLGSALLGALIIGHEFSHRTMSTLLSMPASRLQVLAVKLLVLALMLAALGLLAFVWGVRREPLAEAWFMARGLPRNVAFDARLALLLPPLCGLCLAPWLTMVARSPLAGAVFAGAVLCTIWMTGEMLSLRQMLLPAGPPSIAPVTSMFAIRAILTVCAIGSIASWFTFVRLQPGASALTIALPWRSPRAPSAKLTGTVPAARRRHWVGSVVLKELHLHSMLVAVTLLYVAAWYVLTMSRPYVPAPLQLPLSFLTVFYGAAVSLIAGSFASAEERQIGTAQSQQLLPVAFWQQWAVKTIVLLALAAVLGIGLPLLLQSITPSLGLDDRMPIEQLIVLAFAVGGLYVSSLSTSGLRALVASIGVMCGVGLGASSLPLLGKTVTMIAYPYLRSAEWRRHVGTETILIFGIGVAVVSAICCVALILRFAMTNHRDAERSVRVIRRQALWIATIVFGSTVMLGVLEAAARRDWGVFDGRDGVRVTGHAELEGMPTTFTSDQLSHTCLELASPATRWWANGVFTGDGRFTTAYTQAGPYRVRIGCTPPGWTVKSVTYQGGDVSETPIYLRSDLNDVVVNFTEHPGIVEGTVRAADGKPATGVDVLLFSVNASRWDDNGQASRYVRGAPVIDGRFNMPMPRDGEYYLVAVSHDAIKFKLENGHPVGLVALNNRGELIIAGDPSTLFATLAPFADRIQAREGETITRTLTVKQVR